jgi:predicted esterase
LGGFDPQAKVTLKLERDGQPITVELIPAALPTDIPAELPAAVVKELPKPDQPPATGLVEIKLPEESSECIALVPETYHPTVPHALVIWLHGTSGYERDALEARWKDLAAKHQLIVLAPKSADGKKWEATEAGFVKKTLDDVVGRYNIDRTRIVAFGEQAGGSMAWFVGLKNAEQIRGIAVTDAVPPPRSKLPANDPVQRLAFYTGIADQSSLTPVMKALNERLKAAKFPVTVRSLGEKPRDLDAKETAELARWIDQLDRI